MGLFKSLFGSGQNPADAAMPYLNQARQIGEQNVSPYMQQGLDAQQGLSSVYNQQAKDPSAFLNQVMSNYNPSEGYKYKQQEMLKGARNSAAHGGFSGTDFDQQGQADMIRGLLGGDMQQFIQNALQSQQQGMYGAEAQSNRGMQAADWMGNLLGNQGQLAYQGQAQKNQLRSDRRNALMNMIGTLGGAYMGRRPQQPQQQPVQQPMDGSMNGFGGGNPYQGAGQGMSSVWQRLGQGEF